MTPEDMVKEISRLPNAKLYGCPVYSKENQPKGFITFYGFLVCGRPSFALKREDDGSGSIIRK